MIFLDALPFYITLLITILLVCVKGNEDCLCIDDGLGKVECEIANQACLDNTVGPFLQDLQHESFDDLHLNCNENEEIIFPNPLVREATFTSLEVWCGLSVMEKGTLGNAEATINTARLRLREVPAFQATRMGYLGIYGPNDLSLTNDTFIGYESLQALEFTGSNLIINSIEYGTFSILPNLHSLISGGNTFKELGPGSLYFNPGTIKEIYLGYVEKILPGAISGIPKGVTLDIIRLSSSDVSIEIFGGLLYGGSGLMVHSPLNNCKCSAAWIVRDNTSMALNTGGTASMLCFDFPWPNWGPARLSWLYPEDFAECP